MYEKSHRSIALTLTQCKHYALMLGVSLCAYMMLMSPLVTVLFETSDAFEASRVGGSAQNWAVHHRDPGSRPFAFHAAMEDRLGIKDDNGATTRMEFMNRVRDLSAIGITSTAFASAVVTRNPCSTHATTQSIQDLKKAVESDFVGRRYYVTGDLTPSLYRPDCLFTDPTTRVSGVEEYVNAVKLLFDPDNSQVDLLSLEVEDDKHIFASWRLEGYLKLPWNPYVAPYTGTTRYSVDNDGLIYKHEETWSISALEAAIEAITPTAGPQSRRRSPGSPST